MNPLHAFFHLCYVKKAAETAISGWLSTFPMIRARVGEFPNNDIPFWLAKLPWLRLKLEFPENTSIFCCPEIQTPPIFLGKSIFFKLQTIFWENQQIRPLKLKISNRFFRVQPEFSLLKPAAFPLSQDDRARTAQLRPQLLQPVPREEVGGFFSKVAIVESTGNG